jgi:hypothetical protein
MPVRTWYTAHGMQKQGNRHPPTVHVSFWPDSAADWRLTWHGPQKTASRQMSVGKQSQYPVLNVWIDIFDLFTTAEEKEGEKLNTF